MTEIPDTCSSARVSAVPRSVSAATRRAAPSPPTGDAGGAAPATASAAAAAPAVAAPAPIAPGVPDPEPSAPPPNVQAALRRKRVPLWALPVLGLLPLWGYVYAGTLEPPTGEASGAARASARRSTARCASCHGADGGGGVGPALDGRRARRSPTPATSCSGCSLGSTGWQAEVGDTYGDTSKPVGGGMPACADVPHARGAHRRSSSTSAPPSAALRPASRRRLIDDADGADLAAAVSATVRDRATPRSTARRRRLTGHGPRPTARRPRHRRRAGRGGRGLLAGQGRPRRARRSSARRSPGRRPAATA